MPKPMPRRNMIAFRVDDVEAMRLDGLRATFDQPTWREVFVDWLLVQPEVVALIVARLQATAPPWAQATEGSQAELHLADEGREVLSPP